MSLERAGSTPGPDAGRAPDPHADRVLDPDTGEAGPVGRVSLAAGLVAVSGLGVLLVWQDAPVALRLPVVGFLLLAGPGLAGVSLLRLPERSTIGRTALGALAVGLSVSTLTMAATVAVYLDQFSGLVVTVSQALLTAVTATVSLLPVRTRSRGG